MEYALGLLFKFLIPFGLYKGAKDMTENRDGKAPKWKAYRNALVFSAVIGLVCWANYGTSTEDADPLYGGGETVVDFTPTDKERFGYGLGIFSVLAAATLFGVRDGLKDHFEIERLRNICLAHEKRRYDSGDAQ